ncbi:MAG: adaptor protein MecA, partial [Lachnospiraceae bacterium]|nr:adaptor protein MecA [Lachnospiraceae bacterium]
MKFKRISEKQIQCLISQEELVEKGIAIDDFLDHRDKTEEFLREVVDEAQDVLDIEEMGHFFSVQMHILKTGNISLIINLEGDDGHGESLADAEQASSVLDKIRDKHGDDLIDDTSSGSIKDFIEHLIQSAGFGDNEEVDADGNTSNVERPLSNEELDSIMGYEGFS